jgi:hypothetical protein
MPLEVTRGVTLLQVFDMPTSLRLYCDLLRFQVSGPSQPGDHCHRAWL